MVGSLKPCIAALGAILPAACDEGKRPPLPELEFARTLILVEAPKHHRGPAIRPFFMQRFEVTRAQFQRFVEESGYGGEDPHNFLLDMQVAAEEGRPQFDNGGLMDHPVVWVTQRDAAAYLDHYGLRLPTQREWQAAAQTHIDRVLRLEGARSSGDEVEDIPIYYANTREAGVGGTVPVGFFGGDRTVEGCYDLVGNVAEWTLGWRIQVESIRTVWTEELVLGRGFDEYFLILNAEPHLDEKTLSLEVEPRAVFPLFETMAVLSGNPGAPEVVADAEEILRGYRQVFSLGHFWGESLVGSESDYPRVEALRRLSRFRLEESLRKPWQEGESSSSVGFRGVVDAVELVARVARAVAGSADGGEQFRQWIGSLPAGIVRVLRAAALEEGVSGRLIRHCLRERGGARAPQWGDGGQGG